MKILKIQSKERLRKHNEHYRRSCSTFWPCCTYFVVDTIFHYFILGFAPVRLKIGHGIFYRGIYGSRKNWCHRIRKKWGKGLWGSYCGRVWIGKRCRRLCWCVYGQRYSWLDGLWHKFASTLINNNLGVWNAIWTGYIRIKKR